MSDVSAGPKSQCMGVSPLFLVPDVLKAAEYYRDVLGFAFGKPYGEPPCFVIVWRDCVDIMLKLVTDPGRIRPNGIEGAWDAYVWVSDIEGMKTDLKARGANIVSETPETFYQTKEIDVVDIHGYRICFAQNTARK